MFLLDFLKLPLLWFVLALINFLVAGFHFDIGFSGEAIFNLCIGILCVVIGVVRGVKEDEDIEERVKRYTEDDY